MQFTEAKKNDLKNHLGTQETGKNKAYLVENLVIHTLAFNDLKMRGLETVTLPRLSTFVREHKGQDCKLKFEISDTVISLVATDFLSGDIIIGKIGMHRANWNRGESEDLTPKHNYWLLWINKGDGCFPMLVTPMKKLDELDDKV